MRAGEDALSGPLGMKTMNLVKKEAKKLIEKLPDTATWDDIMYEMYVKMKIAAGLKAADEGRVVSHEEAKKRLLSK
jgi:predicted transcriptional regulator